MHIGRFHMSVKQLSGNVSLSKGSGKCRLFFVDQLLGWELLLFCQLNTWVPGWGSDQRRLLKILYGSHLLISGWHCENTIVEVQYNRRSLWWLMAWSRPRRSLTQFEACRNQSFIYFDQCSTVQWMMLVFWSVCMSKIKVQPSVIMLLSRQTIWQPQHSSFRM